MDGVVWRFDGASQACLARRCSGFWLRRGIPTGNRKGKGNKGVRQCIRSISRTDLGIQTLNMFTRLHVPLSSVLGYRTHQAFAPPHGSTTKPRARRTNRQDPKESCPPILSWETAIISRPRILFKSHPKHWVCVGASTKQLHVASILWSGTVAGRCLGNLRRPHIRTQSHCDKTLIL